MTTVAFDIATFRAQFAPTFDSETTYPDTLLDATFDQAICYVSNVIDSCSTITAGCLLIMLNNLVAHLLTIQKKIAAGESPGIVKSSKVGSVSVSLVPPSTEGEQFNWWLNTTPYGAQVAAQLDVSSAAGFIAGGFNPNAGFRFPDGSFSGGPI